jgi:hypothetical protein
MAAQAGAGALEVSLVRRAPPQSGRALETDELGQVEEEALRLQRARKNLDRAVGVDATAEQNREEAH